MVEDPDWFIKQEKEDLHEKINDLIKKSNKWMVINICVGTFDVFYAIWTDFIIFKILFIGLAILLYHLAFTNYKVKKKVKKIKKELNILDTFENI